MTGRATMAVLLAAGSLALATVRPDRPTQTADPSPSIHRVTWRDAAPVARWLTSRGVTEASFSRYVGQLADDHAARVREGDLDHLVHYLLQSTTFTAQDPIEPALSAKALLESLPEARRPAFLESGSAGDVSIPPAVRARTRDLLSALESPGDDVRRRYFAELVATSFPERATRTAGVEREYIRAMRFLYKKEFAARQAPQPADAVAALYRTRGLSTDTAVEAGYLVSTGLGILHGLDPGMRIRRVLIIGPGLDLAPRTALIEAGGPQSYQPWAVMDALVAHGLSSLPDLEVVAADINPRVVSHLRQSKASPPALTLVTELRDGGTTMLTPEFRAYFSSLGSRLAAPPQAERSSRLDGHLRRTVQVGAAAARALDPLRLDAVVDRIDGAPFDLVIATNVLPYFADDELALAMSGIAATLAPGGVFLHNEARPALQEMAAVLGMPLVQSRQAVIATVPGAPGPLIDSVWLHRRGVLDRRP